MSLHKFAEQVASQGRGDDSLLVHMTPDEVRNLQQFAQANGTTLTINPTTGLPEAGMLSDLFKAIAPIALGAFLGPAGLGMSSMMAGVATGGITTLATGSLSRGLMAGLGAYGGAGLGESLMTAGGGMSAANAATAAQGQLGATNLALGEALPAQAAEQFTQDAVARMTPSGAVSAGFNKAIASPGAAMDFAKGNLGNLAYAAAPIMAGAMVPTTTKLPTPANNNYIRQFDYNINPDTGKPDPLYGMRAMTPVKASEFGDKTFQGQRDLFRQQNPNPYELGVGSLNQPPQQQPARMNTGGIVALANGGIPHYDGSAGSVVGGTTVSPDEAYKQYIQARNAAALQPGGALTFGGSGVASQSSVDASNAFQTQAGNQALAKLGYSMDQYGNIVSASAPPAQNLNFSSGVELANNAPSAGATYAATHKVDVAGNINKFIQDTPSATADQINTAIKNAGMTQADINPYLTANTNISDAARYALSHANEMPGAGGLAGMQANIMKGFATPNLTQGQIDTQQGLYKLSDADIQSPLSHGFQVADTDIAKATNYLKTNPDVMAWLNSAEGKDYIKKHPEFDANDIAFTHYQRYGKGEGRKWEEAATKIGDVVCGPGYKKSIDGKSCVPDTTTVTQETQCPTGYHYDPATKQCVKNVDATQTTTTNVTTPTSIATAAGTALPVGVSGAGITTINPNGTVTTRPDLSLGMSTVRNAYTAGGGSLGYTSPVPKTQADFETLYNKQTGDSLAAYNYLMGKGGAKYPVKSTASQIAVPYNEFVLGKKPAAAKPVVKTTTTVTGTPGNPQSYFDEKAYLAANPSVADELRTGKSASGQPVLFTSGYEHWLKYGKAQGWPFPGDYAGYTTAAALAAAAGAGGGGDGNTTGPASTASTVSDSNTANSITGLAAPANQSITVSDMGPASTASPPGDTGESVSGDYNSGGLLPRGYAMGGGLGSLGSYSDGGRLLRGPGDGVSDSIPATIGRKQQPARLADGEFVVPARIVSELGNGSTDAGAKKLYAMMDRVQRARGKTTGKNKVAANSRSDKYLPA